jgi:hypothetical protein
MSDLYEYFHNHDRTEVAVLGDADDRGRARADEPAIVSRFPTVADAKEGDNEIGDQLHFDSGREARAWIVLWQLPARDFGALCRKMKG